jgi:hypothetical protein
MKKPDRLTELIISRQLVSVMNKTKWKEVANALTSNEAFVPDVRVKSAYNEQPSGFCGYDWELIRHGESRDIEWMDIDPMKREYVGRLVERQKTDYSDWVREALSGHSIPFVEANGLFRITGYLQPSGF